MKSRSKTDTDSLLQGLSDLNRTPMLNKTEIDKLLPEPYDPETYGLEAKLQEYRKLKERTTLPNASQLPNIQSENPDTDNLDMPIVKSEDPVIRTLGDIIKTKPIEIQNPLASVLNKDSLLKSGDNLPEVQKPTGSVVEETDLERAQKADRYRTLLAGLGKSFDRIGKGIAGTGGGPMIASDDRIYDDIAAGATHEKDLIASMAEKNKQMMLAQKQKMLENKEKNMQGYRDEQLKIQKKGNELREQQINSNKEISELRTKRAEAKTEAEKERYKTRLTNSYRKEATSGELGKQYNSAVTADRGEKILSQFNENPSGYTDYASLMLALKTLQGDSSVVREAEMKQGINATSLDNQIKNAASRLASGKSLQPEQRNQMVHALKIMSGIAKENYKDALKPITISAKDDGIPLEKITQLGFLQEPTRQVTPSQAQEALNLKECYISPLDPTILVHKETGERAKISEK